MPTLGFNANVPGSSLNRHLSLGTSTIHCLAATLLLVEFNSCTGVYRHLGFSLELSTWVQQAFGVKSYNVSMPTTELIPRTKRSRVVYDTHTHTHTQCISSLNKHCSDCHRQKALQLPRCTLHLNKKRACVTREADVTSAYDTIFACLCVQLSQPLGSCRVSRLISCVTRAGLSQRAACFTSAQSDTLPPTVSICVTPTQPQRPTSSQHTSVSARTTVWSPCPHAAP